MSVFKISNFLHVSQPNFAAYDNFSNLEKLPVSLSPDPCPEGLWNFLFIHK